MFKRFYHLLIGEKFDGGVNILLTNRCTENCSFCFARDLMKTGEKEMSFENYEKLMLLLKREEVKEVSLMGGEPSIHSRFKEIVEEAIEGGFRVDIFTNGWGKDLTNWAGKVNCFHINWTTESFWNKKKYRDRVIKLVEKSFGMGTKISLETTIDRLDKKHYVELFDLGGKIISKCSVRIGVDGGLIKTGIFDLKKMRKIGKLVSDLIRELGKRRVKSVWLAETYPCMFSESGLGWLKGQKEITINGWGCFSKRSSLDIKTDLTAIKCFYQDSKNGVTLDDGLMEAKKKLERNRQMISERLLPDICRRCHYFGECPGPCLAKL